MTVSMSSGSTSILGTITSTAAIHTVLSLTGQANNNTVTLGTVGASKKWTILQIVLTVTTTSTAADATKKGSVSLAGTSVLAIPGVVSTAVVAGSCVTQRLTFTYGDAPVLSATQTVQVVSNCNVLYADCSVFYVEEAA